MYGEKLSLELLASRHECSVIKPPVVTGRSGVVHRFDFLARDGEEYLGFDVYDRLDEISVIKTFIKRTDTGASVAIICPKVHVPEALQGLLREYNMKVVSPDKIEPAFPVRKSPYAVLRGQKPGATGS